MRTCPKHHKTATHGPWYTTNTLHMCNITAGTLRLKQTFNPKMTKKFHQFTQHANYQSSLMMLPVFNINMSNSSSVSSTVLQIYLKWLCSSKGFCIWCHLEFEVVVFGVIQQQLGWQQVPCESQRGHREGRSQKGAKLSPLSHSTLFFLLL